MSDVTWVLAFSDIPVHSLSRHRRGPGTRLLWQTDIINEGQLAGNQEPHLAARKRQPSWS